MNLTNYDDEMLMQEIKAGNELAFNELFARYEKYLKIRAYLIMRDRGPAQEIMLEVILSIWERREDIVIKKNMAAYLFGAIKKSCAYKQRIAKYYKMKIQLTDFFEVEINSHATCEMEKKEFRESLQHAIKHIDSDGEAFVMYYLDNLKQKEIAKRMNSTEGAIKQQIYRATRIVRSFLVGFRYSTFTP